MSKYDQHYRPGPSTRRHNRLGTSRWYESLWKAIVWLYEGWYVDGKVLPPRPLPPESPPGPLYWLLWILAAIGLWLMLW